MGHFEKLRGNVHVTGAVMSSGNSFLAKSDLPVKSVMSEIKGKGNAGVTDRSLDFAYYGTDEVTNNRFVYLAGIGSAGLLETGPNDIVCIASSTNHLFVMGGVISSFNRGAAAYPRLHRQQWHRQGAWCSEERIQASRRRRDGRGLRKWNSLGAERDGGCGRNTCSHLGRRCPGGESDARIVRRLQGHVLQLQVRRRFGLLRCGTFASDA